MNVRDPRRSSVPKTFKEAARRRRVKTYCRSPAHEAERRAFYRMLEIAMDEERRERLAAGKRTVLPEAGRDGNPLELAARARVNQNPKEPDQ